MCFFLLLLTSRNGMYRYRYPIHVYNVDLEITQRKEKIIKTRDSVGTVNKAVCFRFQREL